MKYSYLLFLKVLVLFLFTLSIYSQSEGNYQNVSGNYKMTMSLLKSEYKIYEPVIAKFELINQDVKPLVIYSIYDDVSYEPGFVTDNSNINAYNNGSRGFYISTPSAKIQHGDTLLFSMPINNWGDPISNPQSLSFEEVYFDQYGYFSPNEYSIYFRLRKDLIERYGSDLKSNSVSFTVTELNYEDEEILRLYKEKKYNEIVTKYPDNPFTEHVWMWNLRPYWITVNESTELDYEIFFNKYPDSPYLFYWRFMLPYFVAAEKKEGSFEMGLNYLKVQQTEGSNLNRSLNNKPFTNIIWHYCHIDKEIK